MAYKAGMTHILREVTKPGSRLHGKETIEMVTILEAPAMVVCGLVGYVDTPKGLRTLTTVWAHKQNEGLKRRFYKNWHKAKGKAFTKYAKLYEEQDAKAIKRQLDRMRKHCTVVRVLAHTQVNKLGLQKKAHLMEIQINGGSVAQKVDFGYSFFEKQVPVDTVFSQDETVDTIAITKGHGFEGVIGRWGVTALPRKTHRGLRKVACIGSWHPARIQTTIARPGQKGYFHRTELNKKIYRIGKAAVTTRGGEVVNWNATTEADVTLKTITPMGGFPHYGTVTDDYVMIKGAVAGVRKRVVTLRKSVFTPTSSNAREAINIKFIDTSSKWGKGAYQTSEEKKRAMA
jgi:large subunit ribosomal protein L3e